jgi:hypothetical protein
MSNREYLQPKTGETNGQAMDRIAANLDLFLSEDRPRLDVHPSLLG